jgi:superfamily II DNA or RNA helicase/SOS-response transcriptional repressor LexA
MQEFTKVFRFMADTENDAEQLAAELTSLREGDWDTCTGRRFGPERAECVIDPTVPESQFEAAFAETFGEASLFALEREYAFVDTQDVYRPVDYVLHTTRGLIAIELNGESHHHPILVKRAGYQRQLCKQNSLSSAGFRVFRWASPELRLEDSPQLKSELERYLGPKDCFRSSVRFRATRQLASIQLHPHQGDALGLLALAREEGKSASLLVLPTALGKTEIAFADFVAFKHIFPNANGLFVVPSSELRRQTLERATLRIPALVHSNSSLARSPTSGFTIQTYQYLNRHYEELSPEEFDYIVVDEAHHALAPGINRFLRHFSPKFLLGITATPERLDQRRLEEVFGSFETPLTLKTAIEQGLLPPVRAFRLDTGVDLSEVRFRGVDYVASDLQARVLVPSRDKLIVDLLSRYFHNDQVNKQGIIFCVNVRHAETLASQLEQTGISAAAVSARDKQAAEDALNKYRSGQIQFLCSCMLINEGFDAPQTSVVVMARPTLSKVLYTQQLGRGTRKYPGKEALYVIDLVDNYAAGQLNAPWSIHSLLGTSIYAPWANVLAPSLNPDNEEESILIELLEDERRIEEIDIFTFEAKYGGFLSEEQMARELFKDTNTIRAWVKKGEVIPQITVPFGSRKLHFFDPSQVADIRALKKLTVHDSTTAYSDFLEYLNERDYSMSYKMVFMLSVLSETNRNGNSNLSTVVERFQCFYASRLAQGLPADRKNCPFNSTEAIADRKRVSERLLTNPFEKFERKRFLFHCKDLAEIGFAHAIWKNLSQEPQTVRKIQTQMIADLIDYYRELGGGIAAEQIQAAFPLSEYLMEQDRSEKKGSPKLVFVPPTPETAWKSCLPLFEHYAAAGQFSESQETREMAWVDFHALGLTRPLQHNMFLLRVEGHSMEPTIPSGALCLFTSNPSITHENQIVLVELSDAADPDAGGRYTVKKYRTTRVHSSTASHSEATRIELQPINPDYETLVILSQDENKVRIRGEFVEVVPVSL